ncbi:hypothetical protein NPN14_24435, partial [Vibrio parahaemolyticus]|uniref:hypothetical protein n=1 Tax=Vibrio parahaemolyticus TaxID=670 RepID=UPI002112ED3D
KLLGLPEGTDEYPLVGPQGLIYEVNVLPGAVFSAASSYLAAGQRFDDVELVQSGLDMARRTISQLWETPANGYEFNTPYMYGSAEPHR